jgi:hypothetical protein
VVFLMNVDSVDEAKATVDALPLAAASSITNSCRSRGGSDCSAGLLPAGANLDLALELERSLAITPQADSRIVVVDPGAASAFSTFQSGSPPVSIIRAVATSVFTDSGAIFHPVCALAQLSFVNICVGVASRRISAVSCTSSPLATVLVSATAVEAAPNVMTATKARVFSRGQYCTLSPLFLPRCLLRDSRSSWRIAKPDRQLA